MKKDRKGEFCVWAHLDKKSLLAVEELKIRANEFLTGPYFGAHLTLVGQIQSINKNSHRVGQARSPQGSLETTPILLINI